MFLIDHSVYTMIKKLYQISKEPKSHKYLDLRINTYMAMLILLKGHFLPGHPIPDFGKNMHW